MVMDDNYEIAELPNRQKRLMAVYLAGLIWNAPLYRMHKALQSALRVWKGLSRKTKFSRLQFFRRSAISQTLQGGVRNKRFTIVLHVFLLFSNDFSLGK